MIEPESPPRWDDEYLAFHERKRQRLITEMCNPSHFELTTDTLLTMLQVRDLVVQLRDDVAELRNNCAGAPPNAADQDQSTAPARKFDVSVPIAVENIAADPREVASYLKVSRFFFFFFSFDFSATSHDCHSHSINQ